MGRPRKDAAEVPVTERIEAALWEAVCDRPVERITVRQLTERAA